MHHATASRPLSLARILTVAFALALGVAFFAAAPAQAQLEEVTDNLPVPPDDDGGDDDLGDDDFGDDDFGDDDFGDDDFGDDDFGDDDFGDDGFGDDGFDDDAQVTATPEGGVAAGLGGMSSTPLLPAAALALTLALIGATALLQRRRLTPVHAQDH